MSAEDFARRLLAAVLGYDDEYGILSSVGLVDPERGKEIYVAAYSPDDGVFVVEEATLWEADANGAQLRDPDWYQLALDAVEHSVHVTADDAAAVLFALARKENLVPDVTLLFEDDEA